jgi:hypothetical protein
VRGGRRAGGRAGEIGDEGTVCLLGIGIIFEITRGRVVLLHTLARDPRQVAMGRGRCVGLIQVGVDEGIAGEAEYRGAIGEKIDVLRADDMRELEHRLAFNGRGPLTLRLAYR